MDIVLHEVMSSLPCAQPRFWKMSLYHRESITYIYKFPCHIVCALPCRRLYLFFIVTFTKCSCKKIGLYSIPGPGDYFVSLGRMFNIWLTLFALYAKIALLGIKLLKSFHNMIRKFLISNYRGYIHLGYK